MLRELKPQSGTALADELRRTLRGDVHFDDGHRALYATDGSNYRQVPLGVVFPRDADDLTAAVEVCRRHDSPVVARGGGTGLTGGCCNVAVVLETSRYMNRLVELDPDARRARIEPGIVLDTLRDAAERHRLTFGPDPSTHAWCTLGGMIGNNACGVHSVMAGKTVDNIESMEVLTYDGLRLRVGPTSEDELGRIIAAGGRRGEIYSGLKAIGERYAGAIRSRFPDIPRRVSGYNIDELLPEKGFNVARALVGSEGTCVTVLEAMTMLVPSPPVRVLLVLGYPDAFEAADHVPEVLEAGPIGLEGVDELLTEFMGRKGLHPENLRLLPEGRGWLFAEFGGDDVDDARARGERLMERLRGSADAPSMKLLIEPVDQKRLWTVRESGLGATAFVPGERDSWEGWEDSAVPPARLGEYLRELRALMGRYGYRGALYGHFGDGCVHTRIDFDLYTEPGVRDYRAFCEEAADLVLRLGGSISGEHGDGYSRSELLPKMFGPEIMEAFREFKTLWDPAGRMNPGKIVDPYPMDANLRLGPAYDPPKLETRFRFPEDGGQLHRATLRCVGVGKCRREEGGTMCPSYMVLRDEMHTTRGRAHLLWEMLRGDRLRDGWRDERVKESLDLCLSCKGCKGECPVQVDIATYKAEFLYHHYKGRLRPRSAYATGLIYWWARLASLAPRLVNAAGASPLLGRLAKWAGGIAPERTLPRFADRTLRKRFEAREADRRPSGEALPAGGGEAPAVGERAASRHAGHDAAEPIERDGSRRVEREESPASAGSEADFRGDAEAGGAAGDSWARPRERKDAPAGPRPRRVILWADTFTNHFHPDIGLAAGDVLEAAGFRVELSPARLCCGRPLYDHGMLDLGRRMLRGILDALRPEIEAGTPIIVLEPSCLAVFRDEMLNLFPDDADARKLAGQCFLFAEFLDRHGGDGWLPRLEGRALVQGHCHQKSLFGMVPDQRLMERLGLECELLDSGCCGMAGAFGFEREKYDVSVRAAERVLLPAVRAAAEDTLLIADGFSCREQVAQGTGRRALHLAEVLARAIGGGDGAHDRRP